MNRRNLALARRIATVIAAAAMTVMVVSPAQAQPARVADAGWLGNIENNLPAAYPVKIADFGDKTNYCHTINAGDQTCDEWWLPSGMSDTDLRGYWFDTDGFQVENVPQYYVSSYGWVPGDVWFKIRDYHEVNCYMSGSVPYCHVYVI